MLRVLKGSSRDRCAKGDGRGRKTRSGRSAQCEVQLGWAPRKRRSSSSFAQRTIIVPLRAILPRTEPDTDDFAAFVPSDGLPEALLERGEPLGASLLKDPRGSEGKPVEGDAFGEGKMEGGGWGRRGVVGCGRDRGARVRRGVWKEGEGEEMRVAWVQSEFRGGHGQNV
jgi:hypothetical protein